MSSIGEKSHTIMPVSAKNAGNTLADAANGQIEVQASIREPLKKNWHYWTTIAALSIVGMLPALEGTVVSTALPTIVNDIGGGHDYIWVVNAYFLTSTAFQPFYGQAANVVGRRWLIISAVALFMIGSGLSGGASDMPMLIAGRTVQGIGGGGVTMMVDLIVSDLVPVRERGTVMGIVFGVATIGTALGPFLGGIMVENATWRWAFYLNIPVAGIAFVLLLAFLQVNYDKESTVMQKLKRIDFLGNAIFVLSVISILLALTGGGTTHAWSSWRTVVPLVFGLAGLCLFYVYEVSRFCLEPTLPKRLFSNRTSATVFVLTFFHTLLMIWEIYFLPVYFQGVLRSAPTRSGVQLLPTVIPLMVFAAVGGIAMEQWGRYKPFHLGGFGLMTIGLGLFTLLTATSSTAVWTIVQVIFSAGTGLSIGTLLAAVQAGLPEEDAATATGIWAFLRSFGTIWGITISATVFNNRFLDLLHQINNPEVRAVLDKGHAYEHATKAYIDSFAADPELQMQIVGVFEGSLKLVWQVAIAISAFTFLVVFFEEELKLRTELNTEFGLVEEKKLTSSAV